MNVSSSSSAAAAAAGHSASTPSVTFVPPPLPAFLTTPCRPGFQTPARHPSTTTSCTQLPPRPKFRRFAWSKIPASRVLGRNNVWTTSDQLCREFKLDFDRIEELFSVVVSCPASSPASLSPSSSTGVKYPASMSANGPQEMSNRTSSSTSKQPAHLSEIHLLDSRRSLNVNVFLRQFRLKSHAELVQIVARGDSDALGAEKLRCLQRVLPLDSERQVLVSFTGDVSCLGDAEQFCLALTKLPNCEGRVEVMLFREEFKQSVERLNSAINAVIATAQQLKTNTALHKMLHMLLQAGNFLNTGGNAGDAAGFRLNSLLNLADLRSNKPRMTLLHYVALEAEEKKTELLTFPDQLESLKDAVECPFETLRSEISSLNDQLKSSFRRLASIDAIFRNKFILFLQEAERAIHKLESSMKHVETLRVELAAYYCEDESTFQLDDAFKVIRAFCEKLQKAVKENRERRVQEQRLEERRRLLEEKLQSNSGTRRGSRSSASGDYELDNGLEEALLSGAHCGQPSRRIRSRLARSQSVCDTINQQDVDRGSSKSEVDQGEEQDRERQSRMRRPLSARRFRLTLSFDDGCSERERLPASTYLDTSSQLRTSISTQSVSVDDISSSRNQSQKPRLRSISTARTGVNRSTSNAISSLGNHQRSNVAKVDMKIQKNRETNSSLPACKHTRRQATPSKHGNKMSTTSTGKDMKSSERQPSSTTLSVPAKSLLNVTSHENCKMTSGKQSTLQRSGLDQRNSRAGVHLSGIKSANSSPHLMRCGQIQSNGSLITSVSRQTNVSSTELKLIPTSSQRSSLSSVSGTDDLLVTDEQSTVSITPKLSCLNRHSASINGSAARSSDKSDHMATGQSPAPVASHRQEVSATKTLQNNCLQKAANKVKPQTAQTRQTLPLPCDRKTTYVFDSQSTTARTRLKLAASQEQRPAVTSQPRSGSSVVTIACHKPAATSSITTGSGSAAEINTGRTSRLTKFHTTATRIAKNTSNRRGE